MRVGKARKTKEAGRTAKRVNSGTGFSTSSRSAGSSVSLKLECSLVQSRTTDDLLAVLAFAISILRDTPLMARKSPRAKIAKIPDNRSVRLAPTITVQPAVQPDKRDCDARKKKQEINTSVRTQASSVGLARKAQHSR